MARDDTPLTDLADLGRRLREHEDAATSRAHPVGPGDARMGSYAEDDPDLHAQQREATADPDTSDTD